MSDLANHEFGTTDDAFAVAGRNESKSAGGHGQTTLVGALRANNDPYPGTKVDGPLRETL